MEPVFLCGRVDRRDGVRVLVPVAGAGFDEASTLFLEESDPAPPGLVLEIGGTERTPTRWPFREVLGLLWPAGHGRMEEQLASTRGLDNRLDLEAALRRWADALEVLLAWWTGRDEAWRERRLVALSRHHPRLAGLLSAAPLDGAAGRRTGEPAGSLLPHSFLDPPAPEPTVTATDWDGWNGRSAEEVLGDHGGLRQLMGEGFESRPGQMDMATAVQRAVDRREHLLVEAGTGIGKSLAYLVPALLTGARRREKVVVSTHTKALQAQLMERDLPLLNRLGYPGQARLLLGRNNYLCRRQLRRALAHPVGDATAALAQLGLAIWAEQSTAGLREELADHPWFPAHWKSFFESVEPCSPHICQPAPACFVVRARRVAREADVVAVNHSLLMMDLKGGQTLIGPHRILVVDEAHQLPEVATRALSAWLAPYRLDVYRNLAGDRGRERECREVLQRLVTLDGVPPDLETRARALDRDLEHFLDAFLRWFSGVEEHCRQRLDRQAHRVGAHRIHDGDEAFGEVRGLTTELLESADALTRALDGLRYACEALEPDVLEDEREGLASLAEFHHDHVAQIRFALAADDEDWVHWFEWGGDAGLSGVVSAPLSVERSFADLWNRHFDAVVLTSATLAVGEDFQPFAESVGMNRTDRPLRRLQVPSPFAFERNALLLTALDLPQPDDPAFVPRVAEVLASIVRGVSTKVMVLATSYRLIEQLVGELRELLPAGTEDLFQPETPVKVLAQTPGASRAALVEEFRSAAAAILVATGSFWEGVDFPGRELEVLVVPRLPFAVPTDPIVEGRYERARRHGRDPFHDVALVDAVLRLKQGVGRLLRSAEDRGAVLLLDQRLQGKAYGVSFLQSLPRTCELVSTMDEIAPRVVRFLSEEGPRAARGRAG